MPTSAATSRLRPVVPREISHLWPEAQGLLPPEFGRDADRMLLLELKRELAPDESEPPDAAAELADAVTALRLATAGAIAAGPVVFERLDFRPLRISPLLPIAATQPRGDATRLDKFRARVAADLRAQLTLADADRELGEALDRWELSLFAEEPFRSAQVREALVCLLGGDGGSWAATMRASVLLTEKGRERGDLWRRCGPSGSAATAATRCAARSSRRSLHGSREGLVLGPRRHPAREPPAPGVECSASPDTHFTKAAQTRHSARLRVEAWSKT